MEQTLQNVVYKIQNMACYQLTAPAQFDFPQPASWPSWLQGFERFRLASKLNDDSEENQVNSLICYGEAGGRNIQIIGPQQRWR